MYPGIHVPVTQTVTLCHTFLLRFLLVPWYQRGTGTASTGTCTRVPGLKRPMLVILDPNPTVTGSTRVPGYQVWSCLRIEICISEESLCIQVTEKNFR
jgi:hypothetical protein